MIMRTADKDVSDVDFGDPFVDAGREFPREGIPSADGIDRPHQHVLSPLAHDAAGELEPGMDVRRLPDIVEPGERDLLSTQLRRNIPLGPTDLDFGGQRDARNADKASRPHDFYEHGFA